MNDRRFLCSFDGFLFLFVLFCFVLQETLSNELS